ncbi:hypothetical protein D3C72_1880950 [compost metagenome]
MQHLDIGVFLQPGNEQSPLGLQLVPPVVIAVALVKDVGHAGLNRHVQRVTQVVDVGVSNVHVDRGQLRQIQPYMHFKALCNAGFRCGSPAIEVRPAQGNGRGVN